nr:MAG TPA: hypothetical protein [Caudoviricetes sp.]
MRLDRPVEEGERRHPCRTHHLRNLLRGLE